MGAFEYTALDVKGKNKNGVLEGDTPRQIRQQLREKGWTPLTVDEVSQKDSGGRGSFSFGNRVNAMDLAMITRQLATLLQAGLPLEEVLRATAQQSDKPHLQSILLGVRSKVREGHSLADGFGDFPTVFPVIYRKTIEAGEQSGHMALVLERLADYTESQQQMKQKTIMALFYPALLTGMAILIVTALLAYVVPQVTSMFDNFDQELPWITQALITTSDTIRDYGFIILIALIGLVSLIKYLLKQPESQAKIHRLILHVPVIGRLVRSSNTARFSRTLSIMVASSVQILEALRISAQVLTNAPMKNAVEEAVTSVREGGTLHQALEKTGYFPPMTLSLIASGESSGNLEDMLERAANIQEREVETMISTLLGLFEPILIFVMGGVVLVIVIAILLPIFELNQLVG